jgi:hypothetical protein
MVNLRLYRVLPIVLPPREVYQLGEGDQAEHALEGIRRIKSRIDKFERMQTEIHVSINSQTGKLHNLFDHFDIDPDA